jgi:hypothetical protein
MMKSELILFGYNKENYFDSEERSVNFNLEYFFLSR